MVILKRIIAWTSSLKVAIFLLFVIAIACAIGTAIPQAEPLQTYIEVYGKNPWIGFINGEIIIALQLNQVYSSNWFLGLLGWLALSLIACSWRRQWPILKAALRWIDYKKPEQLSKLAIAETITTKNSTNGMNQLEKHLRNKGWKVKKNAGRLAARKGVVGRVGPPLIHLGLVLLIFGAAWGSLQGLKVEKFLAPGKSFELLNKEGTNQLTMTLNDFKIERDPSGQPEQFRSRIEFIEPGNRHGEVLETSVNHPLRLKGMTIYQADWSLISITLQIGQSPKLKLPLQNFPQLGEQVWGLILPTNPNGDNPVLMTVSNETGPVQVFNEKGELLAGIRPGAEATEIKGIPISVVEVQPASGLLLKRDPGVPVVYTGFAITLIGGALSVFATRQLWIISDPDNNSLHLGGLSNRDLSGLADEMPSFIAIIPSQ